MTTAIEEVEAGPSEPISNSRTAIDELLASPKKRSLVLCLLLVLATIAVYNPVIRNSFINIDDNGYLTENTHVHQGLTLSTLKWALSQPTTAKTGIL